jgi:hypothetical protein
MSADHDDVVRVAAGCFGKPSECVGAKAHDQTRGGSQLQTDNLGHGSDRDVEHEVITECTVDYSWGVVVNDHSNSPSVIGIGSLDGKGAGTPTDQGDIPSREPGEIGRITA